MKTFFPPALRLGDMIGVMAPSSRIGAEDLAASKAFLEAKGYPVFVHPQSYQTLHQSAGTTEQKIEALHHLIRNPDIRAIFFATGGNRALPLLDRIDYDLIRQNPKIFMGFSDNTSLLNRITKETGLTTYHGPTFRRLPKNPQCDETLSLLMGQGQEIDLYGAVHLTKNTKTAEGLLVGGNLSILSAMADSDRTTNVPTILFLEDLAEEWSHFDRMLCSLKRRGLFENCTALILGEFSDMTDTGQRPFGFSFHDIVAEHTAGLDIPILINAPFGHGTNLPAFPIGAKVRLEGTKLQLPSNL